MQVGVNVGSTKGFRYLWLKKVTGFNPANHCANCLKGSYATDFGLAMPTGTPVRMDYKEGDILYFCGVSKPYVYQSNFHLVGVVKPEGYSSVVLHNGHTLEVVGLEQIFFDDHVARTLYPERDESFLSCRNFQFAAQHFSP